MGLIALFAQSIPATAQDGLTCLSYCNEQVQTSSKIGRQGKGKVSAATYIEKQMVDAYTNVRIAGINVGLASTLNVDTLTVWARASLDGDNLFEARLVKADDGLKKGWNYVGGTPSAVLTYGFYVGYTIAQKGACYAISAVGDDRTGGLFTNLDGSWTDQSAAGYGTLSIAAYISADNLTAYDLALDSARTQSSYGAGCTAPIYLYVSNLGSKTVSGYTVECTTDGTDTQRIHVARTMAPGSHAVDTIAYTTPYNARQPHADLKVSIAALDEGDDANTANNVQTLGYKVTLYDFTQRLFVEEFTTERCSNCPRAAEQLALAMERAEYKDRVIALCHHSGYYTDWLTKPLDEAYLWFYNGNPFAPAFMFNRMAGESSPIYNSPDTRFPSYFEILLANDLSCVGLKVTAAYDAAADRMKVRVDGERSQEFGNTPTCVTVFVSESDIPAQYQVNGGDDYMQQHVLRAYSSVWGTPIEWADDLFSYDCELDVSDVTNKDKAEIIAIVHDYDSSEPNNCAVYNVARAADVAWDGFIPAAVAAPKVARTVAAESYYDLQGRRVSPTHKGFTIVKTTDAQGRPVTSKRWGK